MSGIYQVIVGNIGTVHEGDLPDEALEVFHEYRKQSMDGYGRAASEPVTLMQYGELWREYTDE